MSEPAQPKDSDPNAKADHAMTEPSSGTTSSDLVTSSFPDSSPFFPFDQTISSTPCPGMVVQARHKYQLIGMVGSGGMGSVYLATTLDEGRPDDFPEQVAIKFFNAHLEVGAIQLLNRELASLLALKHDRIPKVLDWGGSPSCAFAVLPYYPHGSLSDELIRGPLPINKLWDLLDNLLSALEVAHRACILHLDIKPSNVLLDGQGGYLLSDFGISQGSLVSRQIVWSGLGAPMFQSPEQRRGEHDAFDIRTDLWGVGITAWYAAVKPRADEMREYLMENANLAWGLPPLSVFREDCSCELEALLLDLLANDADARPGGAAEVLAHVRRVRDASGPCTIAGAVVSRNWEPAQARKVYEAIMDPLWSSICRSGQVDSLLYRFDDNTILCEEGDESYQAFVLLAGRIRVERGGTLVWLEDRIGAFVGEATTLAGSRRAARLRTEGEVWALVLNAAQLERLIGRYPAVAIRLMKDLASRFQFECRRSAELEARLGTLG